jgi:hypothetical protein
MLFVQLSLCEKGDEDGPSYFVTKFDVGAREENQSDDDGSKETGRFGFHLPPDCEVVKLEWTKELDYIRNDAAKDRDKCFGGGMFITLKKV